MQELKSLIKKELTFVLRDTKSLISSTILSIILLPVITFLLQAIEQFQQNVVQSETITIGVNNLEKTKDLVEFLKNSDVLELEFIESEHFEKDFESEKIKGYISLIYDGTNKKIEYIYDQNSNISSSSVVFLDKLINSYIDIYRQNYLISEGIDLSKYNALSYSSISLQDKTGIGAQNSLVLFLFPYFVFISLIQGAMQFAIELTAGEKERNTIITTLSLNVKTWKIALSKISITLLMSIYTVFLNLVSIILTFALFPDSFMSGNESTLIRLDLNMIFIFFIILFPLSFISSALMILIGLYARNQKEAGIYASPILFLSIVIGLSTQAFDSNTSIAIFAIPFLGHIASLKLTLMNSINFAQIATVTISSIIIFTFLIFTVVKLFQKEEILFRN